jgi:hypothetical protein
VQEGQANDLAAKLEFTRLRMTVDKIASVPKDVYYDIGWTATDLPAGSRIYLCVDKRERWVDITHGLGRQDLHVLCGCFRAINRWTETVDWWLEASLSPVSNNFVKSNVIPFRLPVRPFLGPFTTQGIANDPVAFTYTGTGVGRWFDFVRLDAVSFYFRYGQSLECDSRLRGLDCTTFPMALFEVTADVQGATPNRNLAGENIAAALGASADGVENVSRDTLLKDLFGLGSNGSIVGKPRVGLYLVWRANAQGGGHIMVYKGEKDRERYGIHEFTGGGNTGGEWKAVGYSEKCIRDRYFIGGQYWARRIPASQEWRVINTAKSDYFGECPEPDFSETVPTNGGVRTGQSGPVGSIGGSGNGSTYTVASGDSLSLISGRVWGDVLLWPILYDANRKVVGPDPNKIFPGQKLTVPNIKSFPPAKLADARNRGGGGGSYA